MCYLCFFTIIMNLVGMKCISLCSGYISLTTYGQLWVLINYLHAFSDKLSIEIIFSIVNGLLVFLDDKLNRMYVFDLIDHRKMFSPFDFCVSGSVSSLLNLIK